ncbi:MAG TPA: hypothetical protein VKZ63_21605 [Kofleriaceae bacterium]|nr:hypothetical protein [Kofleriaceae bacterium]
MHGERGHNAEGIEIARNEAWLNAPSDVAFGPDGRAWVLDWNNHVVRVVTPNGAIRDVIGTVLEGDGAPEEEDRLPEGAPQGAPGDTVALNHPTDIEFLSDGTLVLAAWHNNKIRVMDPETEIVKVIAGNLYGFRGDGGPAHMASFNQPSRIVVDESDQIYLVDQRNQRIRLIDNGSPRMIDTIAGTGEVGHAGDGGPALEAQFSFFEGFTPSGSIALRGRELYIADTMNNTIRVMNLDTGVIDCIAGTGAAGYSGDGGPALEATFNQPLDIEFGPDGRLYVADTKNNVIRAIDLETGVVERVAGNARQCDTVVFCYEQVADEEPALDDLQLLNPYGIAFDAAGNMYISDTSNHRILKARL